LTGDKSYKDFILLYKMSAYRVAKRVYRSQPVQKRMRVYAPAAKQLYSDVMYLKSIINSELKTHAVQSTNNFSYNGVVISLCNVPQGDGDKDRDGNTVLPRYLSVNGHFGCGTLLTSGNGIIIRMIIFRYWGESTSSATGSIVVDPDEVIDAAGTVYAPLSHLNPDNTGSRGDRTRRIEILKSEIYTAVPNSSCARKSFMLNLEMNGKNVNKKEHITFTNSTTAQPISGGLYIMFVSNSATGTDAEYTIQTKLSFYDN